MSLALSDLNIPVCRMVKCLKLQATRGEWNTQVSGCSSLRTSLPPFLTNPSPSLTFTFPLGRHPRTTPSSASFTFAHLLPSLPALFPLGDPGQAGSRFLVSHKETSF